MQIQVGESYLKCLLPILNSFLKSHPFQEMALTPLIQVRFLPDIHELHFAFLKMTQYKGPDFCLNIASPAHIYIKPYFGLMESVLLGGHPSLKVFG